jgi:uncharacterized protein (TIGR03437 family)
MRFLRFHTAVLVFAAAAIGQTPSVTENSVLNAASYATAGQPGHPVAPGSLVAIFGNDLAAGLTAADSVPLSTTLSGVSVRFNNTSAPLLFVSPQQVNAQLPWDALPAGADSGTISVVVTRGGNASQARNVQAARFSPGIFTLPGTGLGAAVVVNASDGSVAQPAGSVPGVASRPARRGEIIIIYANGLGPVEPPIEAGRASLDALRHSTTPPAVLIGGQEATLHFSGLAPQFPGVNQLNATVPSGAPTGNAVPIQLRLAGITTTDQATIAVE